MVGFIISSEPVCGRALLEASLWSQPDGMVGGDGAWLIADATALPKKVMPQLGSHPNM